MRRVVMLCGLMIALVLGITWELAMPEPGADNPPPLITPAPTIPTPAVLAISGAPADGSEADPLDDVAASVAERPLFSPNRRPSDRRASTSTAGTVRDKLPRLTGVIVGPSGRRAIFAGADGKSRTATEGDTIGGFRVRTIGPGRVTLSGSEGDHVLRPTYIASPGANDRTRPQEGAQ